MSGVEAWVRITWSCVIILVAMSNDSTLRKNRWAFITAMVFWILFLALFLLALVAVVPDIASGYDKPPGDFGPAGEFMLFVAWMFALGPVGVLSLIASLLSLCLSHRKKFSALMLATPFLAFGVTLILIFITESGAK